MMLNLGRMDVEKIDQSDPELIKLIRDHWLFRPSRKSYYLEDEDKVDFSMGQSEVVDRALNHMVCIDTA